jgi:hypothetical protein
MYQYSSTGKQISMQAPTKALKRLGNLMQQENKRLELVCRGGIISLMYFHSRAMTFFPQIPSTNNCSSGKLSRSRTNGACCRREVAVV